jgi:hypothetical protein
MMVKEMGNGVRVVEIAFQNPVIVTSRQDEGLLGVNNFTNPKLA